MFAASKTAAAAAGSPPPATDPDFNYVTMLLHGDGTNGAQNNTFLDSSTNNFTITRNGTPTQGSFSPYGDLWSNSFSGSTQYLTIATNAVFTYATGDFTIEGWAQLGKTGAIQYLVDQRNSGTASAIIPTIYVSASNVLTYFVSGAAQITGTTALTVGVWFHFSVCRSGTSTKLFLNGVQEGSTYSDSNNYAASRVLLASQADTAANFLQGYLSNVRLVKGTALYTSTFTPSTTPLTAVSGTSLLTCQSNRFRDNSSNNFAITATGAPSVQRFSPFDPVAAYSTSVIGGSGYFNGSAQYLNIAATASTQLNADFTIEAWVWIDSTVTASRPDNLKIVSLFSSTGSASGTCLFSILGTTAVAGTGLSIYQDNAALNASITQNIPLDSWVHLAFVRTGSTLYGFINGIRYTFTVVSGSATATLGNSTSGSRIGAAQNTSFFGYWKGYISNFRLVKGTAVYTANFTPPTAPLTAITNTSLLLNTVNAGIFDNAMMNDLVTVGNAQVSTAVTKFGTGSMAFDGTGDWLTFIDTPNVQLGTGDFTIEGWVYLSALGSVRGFFSKGTSTTGISLGVNALNQLVFNYTASSLTATTALVISTWYHVAVVRNGTATGNVKIYLNGTADATSGGAINDNFNQTSIGYIGADRTGASPMNGYIDDLRVTKGLARYTANFTAPTAAFPDN
jgi:hypothetical protein